MLILALTTDKLQLITSAAASVDVHSSWVDLSGSTVTPGKTNTAISTAAATDIVAAPAASTVRNVKTLHVRNKHASQSVDVTVQYNQNATLFELFKATLRAGEHLEYVEGIGFFTVTATVANLTNESVANQTLSTTDAYLVGSAITMPSNLPVVGTAYKLYFDVTKSAGTGQIIVSIRYGTNGSTADTSRCAFTFVAGTGVADTGQFEVLCIFRSVGSGTAAVLQGVIDVTTNLTTTGLTNASKSIATTGGGFDSTPANSIIGCSFNGQTSFAGTVTLVRAELIA